MLYPVGLLAAVWFGSGKDLPQGNAAHTAPQIKTQYSQYSQYSQSAPPAAALQTAAAIQNLIAKNYRRLLPRADSPQGNATQKNSGFLNFILRCCCFSVVSGVY